MRNGAPRKVPLDPDGRTNGEVLQIMLMPMEILRGCVLNADAAKVNVFIENHYHVQNKESKGQNMIGTVRWDQR